MQLSEDQQQGLVASANPQGCLRIQTKDDGKTNQYVCVNEGQLYGVGLEQNTFTQLKRKKLIQYKPLDADMFNDLPEDTKVTLILPTEKGWEVAREIIHGLQLEMAVEDAKPKLVVPEKPALITTEQNQSILPTPPLHIPNA